ncbi:hypothetical protein N9R79_05035 [Vibrio sp.]|nr:hypothetical protein [Vibrio sp.]
MRTLFFSLVFFTPTWVWADHTNHHSEGFQRFFANTRACLFQREVSQCLPPKLSKTIQSPKRVFTQQEFTHFVGQYTDFREKVASCFLVSAKVIDSGSDWKTFYSDDVACKAEKKAGHWKVTEFYPYSSK